VYEIMWGNTVQPGRTQVTNWRMRIACCIPKATNTQWEYLVFIASPLQQCLHERALMLHYTHVARPVILYGFRLLKFYFLSLRSRFISYSRTF